MSAIVWFGKILLISVFLKFSSGAINDLYAGIQNGVTVHVARMHMKQLHQHLLEYFNRQGQYPLSATELTEFLKNEFDTPLEKILMDPWKNPYIFFGDRGEIFSWGLDKKPGTGDDLVIPYPKDYHASLR